MPGKRILRVFPPLMLLLAGYFLAHASTPPELSGLRQSVVALDSAWSRSLQDLRQKQLDGVLGETERRDYAKFITFLSGRIDEYCRELTLRGGPAATADLPCPDSSSTGAVTPAAPARSTAEQVAALDKSLTESLGEFDDALLKEERRIADRQPRERETGGGYGAAPGASGSGGQPGGAGQPGSQGGGTGSQGPRGSGQAGSGGSQSGQGASSSGGGAGAGTGTQTGTEQQGGMQTIEAGYDDIVARQLREAAEKETDPELKEKLWEEYRKYKEGIR